MVKKALRKVGHYLKSRKWSCPFTTALKKWVLRWPRELKSLLKHRERLAAGAVTGINLLLLLLVFLLPIFFLPLTTDLFEFNKEILFLAVTALLLFFWGLRIWAERRMEIARTPYDGPLLLFFVAVLAAAVAAPARVAALSALPTWGLALLSLFYWVIIANVQAAWGSRYLQAYLGSLVVLFFLLLGSLLGSSRWPLLAQLFALSPAGRPEPAQIYFLTGLPVAYFLFKHRLIRPRFLMLVVVVLLGGGILLSNNAARSFGQKFLGVKDNPLPVLDWPTSARLVSASLKENPVFGQGPAYYAAAYARFKPLSLNKTAFWNYRAVPPANTWFYLPTIGGLFLTLAFGWLTLTFFWELRRWRHNRLLYLLTALFFLSSLFYAWTFSFFVLPVFFLALAVREGRQRFYQISDPTRLRVAASVFFILPWVILFFWGKAYAAEVFYKRAWVKLTQNEGAAAYNLLKQAIGLNPYAGAYRRLYAQTNLFLAEETFRQGEPSPESEEKMRRLVEQAQREAKFLTEVWEPGSVESWEVRAGVYRSLLGLIPDAGKEAEAAYRKAWSLSPQDPVWPWQLANLYLTQGEGGKALEVLAPAVVLKDDWPQLYYTLAMAYDAQKDEARVLEMLNKLVAVTAPGTPERERALYLLEQRTRSKSEESGGR